MYYNILRSMLADSAQSLASELDPDLVRGVPLDICMQSWGAPGSVFKRVLGFRV